MMLVTIWCVVVIECLLGGHCITNGVAVFVWGLFTLRRDLSGDVSDYLVCCYY